MGTYTSWRRDRLLSLAERNGAFASTFIEKLQQTSSNNRILHKLFQYALHPRTNNSGRPCTYLRRMLQDAADLFDKLKAGSAAPIAQPYWDEAGSWNHSNVPISPNFGDER